MYSIQLGSFVLNGEILLYAAFGLGGWAVLRYALSGAPAKERLLSTAFNASVIWLLVWKGSLLLFDPASVISQPMSLLYYSGGERGRWLAGIIALLYAAYKLRKLDLSLKAAIRTMAAYLLGGWLTYHLALIFIDQDEWVRHLANSGVSAVILAALMFRSLKIRNVFIFTGLIIMAIYGVFSHVRVQEERLGRHAEVGIDIGQKAPDFELLDLNGSPVRLSDFQGKSVFINFWATWCPPCRAEMPHLQKFYEQYAEDDTVVLGVNLTSLEGNPDAAGQFAEQFGLRLQIVLDSDGKVMRLYQVRAYPTSYFLDADGTIRKKFVGAVDYETMKEAAENERERERRMSNGE